MQNVKCMSFWAITSSLATIRNRCDQKTAPGVHLKKFEVIHVIWIHHKSASFVQRGDSSRHCVVARWSLCGGRWHHFPPAMILRYCSALWAALARAPSMLGAKPWHTVIGCVDSSTRHWHRPLRLRSSETRKNIKAFPFNIRLCLVCFNSWNQQRYYYKIYFDHHCCFGNV